MTDVNLNDYAGKIEAIAREKHPSAKKDFFLYARVGIAFSVAIMAGSLLYGSQTVVILGVIPFIVSGWLSLVFKEACDRYKSAVFNIKFYVREYNRLHPEQSIENLLGYISSLEHFDSLYGDAWLMNAKSEAIEQAQIIFDSDEARVGKFRSQVLKMERSSNITKLLDAVRTAAITEDFVLKGE